MQILLIEPYIPISVNVCLKSLKSTDAPFKFSQALKQIYHIILLLNGQLSSRKIGRNIFCLGDGVLERVCLLNSSAM